jgi:hypothetical protein
MSEKSSSGSTPCVYMLSATVTRQQLPVRSPLPNRQPSTRSRRPSGPVPPPQRRCRGRCGCGARSPRCRGWAGCGRNTRSGRHRCWASPPSTVAGRLRMIGCSGVGWSTSITAAQHLDREIEFGGGEGFGLYSKCQSVCGILRRLVAQHLRAFDGDGLDVRVSCRTRSGATPARPRYRGGRSPCASLRQAGEAGFDQIAARLGEDLDRHVVGNCRPHDRPRDEIEIGRARRGEADLDLLAARPSAAGRRSASSFPRPSGRSAPGCHRAGRWKASAAPCRDGRGPLAVGQVDRREGAVLGPKGLQHGHDSVSITGIATIRCVSIPLGAAGRPAGTHQLTPKGG